MKNVKVNKELLNGCKKLAKSFISVILKFYLLLLLVTIVAVILTIILVD